MKALSVSLNFNPGHFSHLVASYRLFEDMGYSSEMLLAPQFADMDRDDSFIKNFELDNDGAACAIFWFPSLKNIFTIRKLKSQNCQVLYVFHEPFDSIHNYRSGGFSWMKIAKISAINLINILTLKMSSAVILPSKRAFELYNKNYESYNKNFFQIPLLFDDECKTKINIADKKYISYIGTVAEDHAFDKFADFVEKSLSDDNFSEYKFLIATKSKVNIAIKARLSHSRVEILDGRPLTNEEINEQYRKSAIVWNAYNRSMQSGVLPKAFMFGTPVISSQKILNENFTNLLNGISIKDNGDTKEISNAVLEILYNLGRFSAAARKTFLEKFYYKNYVSIFKEILKH